MRRASSPTLALLLAACAMEGDMNPPQESVSDGVDGPKVDLDIAIAPGSGVAGHPAADLADGWTITVDKLLVSVGTVTLVDPNGVPTTHEENAVVDVRQLSEAAALGALEIPATTLQVRFTLPAATDRFLAFESTAPADRDLLAANGWSIYLEGRIDKPDGMTCTTDKVPLCTPAPSVSFRWGLDAGATFSGCPDLVADPGDQLTATLTLPADRVFHLGFRDDDTAAPVLRAQWLADADLDRNGETTLDELGQIKASTLFPRDRGYDLAGAPIPVATARDFVEAQARTLGRHALGLCPDSSAP